MRRGPRGEIFSEEEVEEEGEVRSVHNDSHPEDSIGIRNPIGALGQQKDDAAANDHL